MQPTVEIVSGLEHRVNLYIATADIEKEVQKRLRALASGARVPGFRPGRAPLSILARTRGKRIRLDVINAQIKAILEKTISDAKLRMVEQPVIYPNPMGTDKDTLAFSATFEVYPEIELPDLAQIHVSCYYTEVAEEDVEKTLRMLQRQKTTFESCDNRPAEKDDRVTIDFTGTVEGVPFEGSQAKDFSFVLGQNHALPEVELATTGLKRGDITTCSLRLPTDYHVHTLAGKVAHFTISVKEVLQGKVPDLDESFAKSMGQSEGNIEKLKEEIRITIEHQAKSRNRNRTKSSVMDSLSKACTFDVPKVLVKKEVKRLINDIHKKNKAHSISNPNKISVPTESLEKDAQSRIRLGILLSELVRKYQICAEIEETKLRVEELVKGYDKPQEMAEHCLTNPQRKAEIETLVTEDKIVARVLDHAQVINVKTPFNELMGMI